MHTKILAIETSCDETALSLVEASGGIPSPSFKVLGSALYSQAEMHAKYGGVFPSLAKREHSRNLVPLLVELLKKVGGADAKSNVEINETTQKKLSEILSREPKLFELLIKHIPKWNRPDFDMIAVTSGPGLEPALWVGINFARALSLIWNIPIVPVNHMEGHIASVLLGDSQSPLDFPALALLISGGHTELVKISDWGQYKIIGRTKDDAVGEAFDKTARLLGLPYPGGPEISRLAALARNNENDDHLANSFSNEVSPDLDINFSLPRPMINSGDFDFSFSGLKTAVLYLVKKVEVKLQNTKEQNINKQNTNDAINDEIRKKIAYEFEEAVTEVLIKKTLSAIEFVDAKTLIIGGGVIANKYLRSKFSELAENANIKLLIPQMDLATDNATMIGLAGYLKSFRQKFAPSDKIFANGNLSLSEENTLGL